MKFATDLSKGILGGPDSPELWSDITSHIPDSVLLKPNVKILSVACGHGTEAAIIVKRMLALGISKKKVNDAMWLIDKYHVFTNAVTDMGFKNVITVDFLEWKTDMKFDVCLMNSPYTKGAKLLYTYFFKKGLDLANTVVSVMPLDLTSGHDKLKFHNQRVEKHNSFISENVSGYFNVGLNNIHYVIASRSTCNEVIEKINSLESLPILFPKRKRMKFIAGDTDCGKSEEYDDGIEVVYSVLKDDNLVTKKIAKEIAKKSCRWTESKYSVFVNYTPSNGFLNCAILKNCKMTWTRKVFMVECKSLTQAKKVKVWLQSKKIQNEIVKMFKSKSDTYYTLSLEMANRLPYYE